MLDEVRRGELRTALRFAVSARDAAAALGTVRALAGGSEAKPGDVFVCASALGKLGREIGELSGMRRLRTFVARSVTVEPMLPQVVVEGALAGMLLEMRVGGFGSWMDELLNPEATGVETDLLLLVLDVEDVAGRLPEMCADGVGARVDEEIAGAVARLGHLLRSFRAGSRARVMVQGFVLPDVSSLGLVGEANLLNSLPNAVGRLNTGLARVCAGIADCVFFDVDRLAAQVGRRRWSDTRLFLASRLPVAAANFVLYARGVVRSVAAMARAPRKVLCTDLDNTLWGGVLGEEGVGGIVTGSTFPGTPYLLYQRYLKQLASRGVLLVAVSKNNEADVREAFAARSADLAVGLDDFAALKISWGEKSEALRELAQELSLGLDSFVFVDDNPVEAEAIRQRLPEVAVVEAPVEEPWRLLELLADEAFFDVVRVTEDDRNRLGDYKAQAQRAELEATVGGDRESFLASLETVCTFGSALDAPLARAVQLMGKTNQFNLTTRRRSAGEIEQFVTERGGQAIAVRVRDRFGDAGVVGLALARTVGTECVIDSLLLSCRVIGRGVETALLAQIAATAARDGATRLVGEYIATKKNQPCATFYRDHGFAAESEGASAGFAEESLQRFALDLTDVSPAMPAWITLEGVLLDELRDRADVAS